MLLKDRKDGHCEQDHELFEIRLEGLDEKKLKMIGNEIGKKLTKGDLILLKGELGSGKTTLTKAIAEGLGIDKDKIRSPSFILMNIYSNHVKMYHMDLYRLNDEEEFILTGLSEYLYSLDGITVIEWADKISNMEFDEFLEITLYFEDENKRSMRLRMKGERFKSIFESIMKRMNVRG